MDPFHYPHISSRVPHWQVQPDYLFISTWNEHVAQSRPLPSATKPGGSMGFESDTTAAAKGFVGAWVHNLKTQTKKPTQI